MRCGDDEGCDAGVVGVVCEFVYGVNVELGCFNWDIKRWQI